MFSIGDRVYWWNGYARSYGVVVEIDEVLLHVKEDGPGFINQIWPEHLRKADN